MIGNEAPQSQELGKMPIEMSRICAFRLVGFLRVKREGGLSLTTGRITYYRGLNRSSPEDPSFPVSGVGMGVRHPWGFLSPCTAFRDRGLWGHQVRGASAGQTTVAPPPLHLPGGSRNHKRQVEWSGDGRRKLL